jgi:outer membrane protein OmpA-like peptidoglycan-associated protein
MRYDVTLITVAVVAALATGCATQRQTETAVGTGVGAVSGAAIGGAVGGGRGAAVGTAVGAGAGAAVGYNWQLIKEKLGIATRGSGVQVSETRDGLRVNVPGSISFATGSAAIEPRLYPTLDRIATTLNEYPASTVTVVGHTDNVGDAQSNQELAARRANAVVNYLTERGVQRGRMVVQGRGEAEPIANNSTEAGRAQNRRVEMLIRAA